MNYPVSSQSGDGTILFSSITSPLSDKNGSTAQITHTKTFRNAAETPILLSSALDNQAAGYSEMRSKDNMEIGKQLSFALYGAANRMNRLHKPFLDPLGLTFPQYLVMLELFCGTPRAVGELGSKLDMDTGTITPLLKRLEASGRVKRTRDPADERRVLITLTEAGDALREPLWCITDKIKTACQLSEEGLAQLRDTLNALSHPASDQVP